MKKTLEKKIFAILAIIEIFAVIAWVLTYLFTSTRIEAPDANSLWTKAYDFHIYLQVAMIALGYVLALYYLKPKAEKPKIFFILITYFMLFGFLATVFYGSLFSVRCYLQLMLYLYAITPTVIIVIGVTYSSKIYHSLTA